MKLPIRDLNTNKLVSLDLEPYLTVFLFSLRHLRLFVKFSKDVYRRAVGVYIGDQMSTLISWYQLHPNTLNIYNGSKLKYWEKFGVVEKPWVLVVDSEDILLSMNANDIPEPYFKNIVIRMKVPLDFRYETSSDEEEDEEIREKREKEAKIQADQKRMMELVKMVQKNYDDIELMKLALKEKEKTIEEITEKLQILQVKRGKVKLNSFKVLNNKNFLNDQNSFLQGKTNSSTPVPEKNLRNLNSCSTEPEKSSGILQSFRKSKLKSITSKHNPLRKSEDLKYFYHY